MTFHSTLKHPNLGVAPCNNTHYEHTSCENPRSSKSLRIAARPKLELQAISSAPLHMLGEVLLADFLCFLSVPRQKPIDWAVIYSLGYPNGKRCGALAPSLSLWKFAQALPQAEVATLAWSNGALWPIRRPAKSVELLTSLPSNFTSRAAAKTLQLLTHVFRSRTRSAVQVPYEVSVLRLTTCILYTTTGRQPDVIKAHCMWEA